MLNADEAPVKDLEISGASTNVGTSLEETDVSENQTLSGLSEEAAAVEKSIEELNVSKGQTKTETTTVCNHIDVQGNQISEVRSLATDNTTEEKTQALHDAQDSIISVIELSETKRNSNQDVPNDLKIQKSQKSDDGDHTSSSLTVDAKAEKIEHLPCDFSRTAFEIEASSSQKSNSASSSPTKIHQSAYHIKWIDWKDKKVPVITQNENGPCPLIAIMNVLILKEKITLPSMMEIITPGQLMEYLGDCILENMPKNISEGAQLNYEQNMHDAMSILPKLQTGLDVNVRFTSVDHFEYTPELIVFDLLHIPLYHGWLVDPQSPEVQTAVGNCSYNQLVENIINNKASAREEVVTEALLAESFLGKTASQLTYHGLCELTSTLKDEELCVLFRNNHFITLYKRKDELFQLVTDQGFLTESKVVWETLNNVEGDGHFVDANFVTVPPKAIEPVKVDSNLTPEQQTDQDYLVALTMQEEQQKQDEQRRIWEEYKQKNLGGNDSMTDEELARRLQEEENRYAAAAETQNPRRQSGTGSNSSNKSKNRDCALL
ncbi:ubiquitin carboxyl-terminal hydrolase MINDY-2-like isoform X1 [Tachypleus tridentatus]|uniref:ubiquitin carboxyl-terminal hydrolase MINDY-2-like isoform X1 n=1 Tax=Tachypleus tridentatus TaxID=6853 RepID=UPI003FCF34F9